MLRYLLFILLFTTTSVYSESISSETDSLKTALSLETDTMKQSLILAELVKKYYSINKDTAQQYAWQVYRLDQKEQANLGAAVSTYLNLTKIKRSKRQYDSAVSYGQLAFDKLEIEKDSGLLSEVYESFGRSYLALKKYDQAVENFMKGFELAEEQENWNLMANIAGNCAKSLDALGKPEEGLALCLKVLDYDKGEEISKEYI